MVAELENGPQVGVGVVTALVDDGVEAVEFQVGKCSVRGKEGRHGNSGGGDQGACRHYTVLSFVAPNLICQSPPHLTVLRCLFSMSQACLPGPGNKELILTRNMSRTIRESVLLLVSLVNDTQVL